MEHTEYILKNQLDYLNLDYLNKAFLIILATFNRFSSIIYSVSSIKSKVIQ